MSTNDINVVLQSLFKCHLLEKLHQLAVSELDVL